MSEPTYRRRGAVALACLAAFGSVATDCGTTRVHIAIGGNIDSEVTFTARLSHDRPTTITEFAVIELDERVPLGNERVMWRLSGESDARTIAYGATPDGLVASTGPSPLQRGTRYTVFVRAEGRYVIRLRGAGSCAFSVDADGEVDPAQGCRLIPN